MNNIVTLERILEFVDVPQLFLARDMFDTRYLCLLYDDDPVCKYTAVRISAERYSEFMQGKIDLRSIYMSPEYPGEYFSVVCSDGKYIVETCPSSTLEEEHLPEAGYFYEDNEVESITIQIPKKEKNFFMNLLRYKGWVAM